MPSRRRSRARMAIIAEVDDQVRELKKFHRKHGVRVTVLKHKWPRSRKVIVIMGANN
jgi:hypothetical protein